MSALPEPSALVAVRSTSNEPGVVGVPLMIAFAASNPSQAGNVDVTAKLVGVSEASIA